MRIPRRGTIAQRKGGGYVWAVYSLAPGVDESVFTTGSFTMTASFASTPYLMAADGYTVDSSGKITLTSATRTNVSALAAGKYIVSISSSSSTATTSTQYVYKVTGVTSSGSTFSKKYTVSYEQYEVSLASKGEDTGVRVSGATDAEYPINGAQNGYYYVLINVGADVVWLRYNTVYGKELQKSGTFSQNPWPEFMGYYGWGYTVDGISGKFTLTNATRTSETSFPENSYIVTNDKNNYDITSGIYLGIVESNEPIKNDELSRTDLQGTWYLPKKNGKGAYIDYVHGTAGTYPDSGIDGDYYYERTTPY